MKKIKKRTGILEVVVIIRINRHPAQGELRIQSNYKELYHNSTEACIENTISERVSTVPGFYSVEGL
jgi:hypothetical protein